MSFGSMIKKLRKEKSLTQDQLANLLNVTPQAISRWETNAAMPDISLLVPLANVFNVSTDTLLEVNVQKNEEHIRDFCQNYYKHADPYGKTNEEKIRIYREEVRKYPECTELKEILIALLEYKCTKQGAFPESSLYQEMASLTEDIIAVGGGREGLAAHHQQLVRYSKLLNNQERASEIVGLSSTMDASSEVLLPASLSGRAQIDARKKLIFKCIDTIIKTVYDLYEENAAELTEDEWNALQGAENVVATMYGQAFSDHFVLARHLYKSVHGALQRGDREDAVQRLQRVVDKLQALETDAAVNSPLVEKQQFEDLCMNLHAMFSVPLESMMIVERVLQDFRFDSAASYREENPQFDSICETLSRLMDSDGGQSRIDCWKLLEMYYKTPSTDA